MKFLLAGALLIAGSAEATSIGGITASTGNFCEHLAKSEVAFVGKVNGWSVVVETVVKGPALKQADYKLAKPLGDRFGERYLISADMQQPDNFLNVRDAWDVKYWDPRSIEALRESASGGGPKLSG